MSDKKVKIISTVPHRVVVILPELRFKRSWDQQGAEKILDYDLVQEAMGDIGFYNMIQDGTLYIEDMDIKKELDIEPQDAKEPVNVIIYTDAQIEELLSNKKTLKQLENALNKVSESQQTRFAQKAVELRINDLEKARLLKEYTEMDVAHFIQMAIEDDKEEATEQKSEKKTTTKRKK